MKNSLKPIVGVDYGVSVGHAPLFEHGAIGGPVDTATRRAKPYDPGTRDTGCFVSPKCLDCPLLRCRLEKSHAH